MKKFVLLISLHFTLSIFATTPMDEKIPEDQITIIECQYKYSDKDSLSELSNNEIKSELSKEMGKTFHYRVYLPKGYYENTEEKFPCIFVASPGGNAPMINIETRMKKDKWIVIMLVESRNDDPLCPANFLSAHDDAIQRFKILEGMKYTTGFSGGARCSSLNMGLRPGFAGVILQGAGFAYIPPDTKRGIDVYTSVERYPHLAVYMLVGTNDGNKREIEKVYKALPHGVRFKSELFNGGHTWAPVECMDNAFDWLEQQLLTSSILEKDKQICINILKRQLPKAFELGADFEKYEILTSLEPLVKLHKLDKVLELSENIGKMNSLLKLLKTDKNIQVELKAKTAFLTALKNEGKVRDKISKKNIDPQKNARELKKVLPAYQQIVKTYGNTVYGVKAKEKTDSIQKEIE